MKKLDKKAWQGILNIAFIVGTFLMVGYFAIASGELRNIGRVLRAVAPLWLLGAVACFGAHAFIEGASLYVFFRFQKVRVPLKVNLMVGLIGMYYSAITPAATGGQPMQVFSLKKRGVAPGIASSALAVKFFCWQCALLLMGAVAWLISPGLVASSLQKGVWVLVVGFIANSLAVAAVILLAVARNAVRGVIIFLVNVAAKIRLVKDKARTSSKWDAALEDFHASVDILTQHPLQFLVLFVLSLVQVTALMSAIYFVYRGFGLHETGYGTLLTLQLMLFIAASFTPLPGASGAQEGGFILFLGGFFPPGSRFAALFVWRFITYYLSIIVGFAAVVLDGTGGWRGRRQAHKQLRAETAAAQQETRRLLAHAFVKKGECW